MKYKWHYFLAAVFFASYMLISRGVPLLPVLVGCAAAALLTWGKAKASAHAPQRR